MVRSVAATLALLMATPAAAQPYVRADCALTAPASFDTPVHARWYKRFWTGECDALPWTCLKGEPNWNSVVDRLTAKAEAARRPAVKPQACRLGALIGYEWSRAKPVRRIDTADLQSFLREVNAAPDVGQGLNRVDARVRDRLSKPKP